MRDAQQSRFATVLPEEREAKYVCQQLLLNAHAWINCSMYIQCCSLRAWRVQFFTFSLVGNNIIVVERELDLHTPDERFLSKMTIPRRDYHPDSEPGWRS